MHGRAAAKIVVIGTSWGGLHALRALVSALPEGFHVPIVIVQHRHRQSDGLLRTLLQEHTGRTVCEVEDKQPILPDYLFLAPADYHLLVEDGHFALSVDEPVRYSRPSIDVTFVSAADAFGAGTVGVVLTGANADGAAGLARIASRGGTAIVQAPETAESAVMPRAALEAVPTAHTLTLAGIGQLLGELASDAGAERS